MKYFRLGHLKKIINVKHQGRSRSLLGVAATLQASAELFFKLITLGQTGEACKYEKNLATQSLYCAVRA
jgi:hypothetical protein